MGNCQGTADAEAIVIYHPGISCNGSYKIYRSSSVTAEEIMVLYPGYYVSLVGKVSTEGIGMKQIKLLGPRDTLSIGCVYRLISLQDVPMELSARTRGKLVVRGRADRVDEEGGGGSRRQKGPSRSTKSCEPCTSNYCSYEVVEGTAQIIGDATTPSTTAAAAATSSSKIMHSRQWRPSLESISEFGG